MPLLISDYFMQMAEGVYGDAAATERERGAATLARWIFRERPTELHVRRLQREEQLPGRRSAEQIRHAAEVLVEATGTMFGVSRSGGIEKTRLISLTSEERCTRPHMARA